VLKPDQQDVALADPNVHAAMCASTTSTHEGIIRACFQHKKPCFTEKPVAETVERTMEVCKLSTQTGVPLFCGFNRRSDEQFLDLKRRIDAGVHGRTMMIKSCSRDYPTNCPLAYIKISGGQFVDQSVHDIDICMWIAKEKPHTVYAMGASFYPDIAAVPDTDTVTINLQFPSGAIAIIGEVSFLSLSFAHSYSCKTTRAARTMATTRVWKCTATRRWFRWKICIRLQ
jgi:myo-inositol 2-dehydrogenase/D-chiro-inositol 1-dehydrogenase